ncbi:type IX secretion system membrane protein, PorP/SprF family [Chitinophaga jiangningensis]|uniref:Type IX secretion system membrane protein, PorP/SprF family n=1 Tax=Chitinophaga jiangningensis TaxID=1419482 RepID=A0A1M7JWV1_9BACT|nr:PorP/SprF family type IX secretion system membrane protein [Chitinophaga jiangningensis]SHM57401.1 type IX secretion system membrane protein, PorP/SprF family [Chitinophaga jiangningensis]
MKFRILILSAAALTLSLSASAQSLSKTPALLEPSSTQYYMNQYLANPAMAGADSGLHVNAAYRAQMNAVEGAPETKFFTADGYIGNRVGAGLNVMNDKAGLLSRTRVAATYAYHLPLNENGSRLHFGISLGLNFQRLDYDKIDGDNSDPAIGAFNRRDDYFEADFGMAYTNQHWNIQAALPNIRSTFSNKTDATVNGGTILFTALSYRFLLENAVSSIEPKLAYRAVKGYEGIADIGLNVGILENVANVTAFYHTSGSYSVGAGVRVANTVRVLGMYTKQTSGYRTLTDGGYEIALALDLFR